MKRSLIACLLLGGCGGVMFVGPDGATHQGTFDSIGRTMSVNIRGVEYSGNYVLLGAPGTVITTNTSTVSSTGRRAYGTAQTYVPGSGAGNGRALLTSAGQGTMSCEFMYSGMSGAGACQDQVGQTYQFQTR